MQRLAITSEQLIFFSDLHLAAGLPHLTVQFELFMEQLLLSCTKTPSSVFILGDLFEVWLGDDCLASPDNSAQTPWLESIIQKLSRLATLAPTYFIRGNRDFLIGEQFSASTNMTCLNDIVSLQLKEFTVLLCHGDHLCTQDEDYMKFRRMVRSPQWQAAFLAKPLPERQAIAQSMRDQSGQSQAAKDMTILDVDPCTTAAFLNQHQHDLMIQGHTHRPAIHAGTTRRLVLGDWDPRPSWAVLDQSTQHALDIQLHARDWSQHLLIKK